MFSRTTTTLLLPVVVATCLVAGLPGSGVARFVAGIFSSEDPVVVRTGDIAIMVAGDAESKIKGCPPPTLLNDRRCGTLKVVVINAERMPFIARNIQLAWADGHPFLLHRNSAKQAANRIAACGSFTPKYPGGSCDEYPFATTNEGGSGARTEEVPVREQRCQGGAVNAGYTKADIRQGDEFLVVVSAPSKIASTAYAGHDVAGDSGACES
jgi:hypothetical protein